MDTNYFANNMDSTPHSASDRMLKTLDMLRYATPFYKERARSEPSLIGGADAFMKRLRKWILESLDELLSVAKTKEALLYDHLNTVAQLLTGLEISFEGDAQSILHIAEGLAHEVKGNDTYMHLASSDVRFAAYRDGCTLCLCILKYDVIDAINRSGFPAIELDSLFYGFLHFMDARTFRQKSMFLTANFLTANLGCGNRAPLWMQFEPFYTLENSIMVAFRKRAHRDKEAPILTASLDYRELPTATLNQKLPLGECKDYPRSIVFCYDPWENFKSARAFNNTYQFRPASKYGESALEVFRGDGLCGAKAGDMDLQTIALTCSVVRLEEIETYIDRSKKELIVRREVHIPYENDVESAYFDFIQNAHSPL